MEIEEKIQILKDHITQIEKQLISLGEAQLKFNKIVELNIDMMTSNIKLLHDWKLEQEGK